jgi:hypothetical protein
MYAPQIYMQKSHGAAKAADTAVTCFMLYGRHMKQMTTGIAQADTAC